MSGVETPWGRAWVFGGDVNTDVLAPGIYMKGGIGEMAEHCLETIDPDFAPGVRTGDVVVGGANFGIGSSREQAVEALKLLGVSAVLARSFGGIFFRNALNLGLVAVACETVDEIRAGDRIRVDAEAGIVLNHTQGATLPCEPLPPQLLAMIADGGLIPHLEKKLKGRPRP